MKKPFFLKRVKTVALLLGLGVPAIPLPVFAADPEELGIETHAFLSQGFIKTTANDYLAKSKKGSFNFTEAGLNFTKQLNSDLRMGIQLFARNLGPTGTFNAKLDWFYLDYHWSDRLGFRFGRVKLPFGLYNDSSDIDAAHVPILLPQSVYPIQERDFLLAQSGVELYGYTGKGPAGALDYRFYGGTIINPITNTPGSPNVVRDLNVPYVAGQRLLWETPIDGLRLSESLQALEIDTTVLFGGTPVSGGISALLYVGSLEFSKNDLLLAAEYSRWHEKITETSNPELAQLLAPRNKIISERAYAMGSYRLNSWLQPALYYSVLYPDINRRSGLANQQHDVSATLRFDVNRYWFIKLEGHYMRGVADLDSTLNNAPVNDLTQNWRNDVAQSWGVFLVKATAYF